MKVCCVYGMENWPKTAIIVDVDLSWKVNGRSSDIYLFKVIMRFSDLMFEESHFVIRIGLSSVVCQCGISWFSVLQS